MKRCVPLIMVLSIVASLTATSSASAADVINLTPSEKHHIAGLNSNQPYVAGYHVETPDLYTRERVDATAITVSFPSSDASSFPADSWLGVGMFVQGQDSRLVFVDYAYYTMLVIDSSGSLFVDIGLHQTRESTAPLQMPTEELVYAYTWEINGMNPATPVTLIASWDSNGYLYYSVSAAGTNTTLFSVKVSSLPNCESAISKFYAGTSIAGSGFPLGHFVYYFQFGVISDKSMGEASWSAHLTEPRILRPAGWKRVETAMIIQGDISYLDADWMWGGAAYHGVQADHDQDLLGPFTLVLSPKGRTVPSGTVLWDNEKASEVSMIPPNVVNQPFRTESAIIAFVEVMAIASAATGAIYDHKLRRKDPKIVSMDMRVDFESLPKELRRRGLKEKLVEVCQRNDVVFLAVFGSFARGEQRAESDVDVAIEFDRNSEKSLFDLVRVEDELTRLFERKVDLGIFSSLNPYIIDDVKKEMKIIYEKR